MFLEAGRMALRLESRYKCDVNNSPGCVYCDSSCRSNLRAVTARRRRTIGSLLEAARDGSRRRILMSTWSRHPVIYEINTWVWLSSIGSRIGRSVLLSSVPAADWDALAGFGFEAVWLMGVWERSPASRAIANQNQVLLDDFRRTLPDFRPEDNIGSAYSVRRYTVDPDLGGAEGLATARQE